MASPKVQVARLGVSAATPVPPKMQVSRLGLSASVSMNVFAWDGFQIKAGRIGAYSGGQVHYPA